MPDPSPSWRPSVQDVAGLIPTRTKVAGGDTIGTFSDKTKVSAEAVEGLITIACRRVASAIGGIEPCAEDLSEDAGSSAAIYAACLVEQGYWPEQTRNDTSSFKSLWEMWKDSIKTLADAVSERCGGAGVGEDAAEGQLPKAGEIDGAELLGRTWPVW